MVRLEKVGGEPTRFPPGEIFAQLSKAVTFYPSVRICGATSRDSATQALAEPEEARASPQQTKQDRKRIRELERELHRKDKALAETAALLVLSRKLEAVFNKDKGEAE